jgi:hypothetical protein
VIPVTDLIQRYTVRLIPSAYFKAPILRPLVESDEELEVLEALDALTNPRRQQRRIDPEFDSWAAQCVEAAFAYRPVQGLRFNDATFGAWYAGFEDQTALNEVAFHKSRQLEYIGVTHEISHYQALHAGFIGSFHDARPLAAKRPDFLLPDTGIAYPAGQVLARELRQIGSRGLVYPSARYEGGTCIVAFKDTVVQDVQPGTMWELVWSGTSKWEASPIAA